MGNQEKYEPIARAAAKMYGIPETIFIKLITQESGWNPDAQGSSGEIGIAQFMPDTASSHGVDPSNPEDALYGAAQMLAEDTEGFGGDLLKGLAAYNAGSGAVASAIDRYGADWAKGIPQSTRGYVAKILEGSGKQLGQTTWEPYLLGDTKQKPPGDWSGLESGASIKWPSPDDYGGVTMDYLNTIAAIASAYATAEMPLPSGAPDYAQAVFDATTKASGYKSPEDKQIAQLTVAKMATELNQGNQLFPLTIAQIQQGLRAGEQDIAFQGQLNPLTLEELRQKIRRGEVLLPLEIQQLEQAIRLGEPFGGESVLRSDSGSKGFKDYWSRTGLDANLKSDKDYMAGYNLAKAEGDPEKRKGLTDYIDTVIGLISADLGARNLSANEATAEFQRHLDAFSEAGTQFRGIQPYTIPSGSKFVPGFEEGGIATQLGMKPWEASPTSFDPFKMAQDIIAQTPKITDIGAPTVPAVDQDALQTALKMLYGTSGAGGTL